MTSTRLIALSFALVQSTSLAPVPEQAQSVPHAQGGPYRTVTVRAYLRAEKQALLDAVCAGNPLSLKDVRDNSENSVARVNAARSLELMKSEMAEENRDGGARTAPGLVVMIVGQDGRAERAVEPPVTGPVIDARPDEFTPLD